MALSPIAFIAPNYRDFKTWWLKAYETGTTTPLIGGMALDSEGATTVAKLQLNADGFIIASGGALVIPYIDGAYDLWLFPTESEADNNDTSSALRLADDLGGSRPVVPIVGIDYTGVKVTRANNNKHYGWGSTAVLTGGRWMQIFRSSSSHATTNNSQVMMHYSDDLGSTWFGEVEIFRQADSDARPDAMYVMANGRIGFIINRATSPALSPYYQPLFYYTDNEGVSWQSVTIPLSSPYTFSSVGGIIDFPLSQ